MNTDQIAAEAWDEIYNANANRPQGISIIKSAIEKAIVERDKLISHLQDGRAIDFENYKNYTAENTRLRAAHASEQGAIEGMNENSKLYERFNEKWTPEPYSGCWLWMHGGTSFKGQYGQFHLGGKDMPAHRASWIIYRGLIPEGMSVLHHCDTPRCVNPDHLFTGTHLDNMRDCKNKGRNFIPQGELSPAAKLTNEQVLEIRADKRSNRQLAKIYGVNRAGISRIRSRQIWRHI